MEKLRLIFVLAMLLASLNIRAGWRVVIDKKTTAAVMSNAASQKLIEDRHNGRLDSINTKQEKLMKYTATMASIKELYQLSMQNITGFGEESRYYGEIVSLTASIFKDVPIVLKQLGKSPGKNYVVCLNEMTNLVSETQGLVHDFVNIVNNGKVRNPLDTAKDDGKDDGYNLLNRYERLTMANKIYSRLLEIHYKLEVMVMMCQFGNNWGDVLIAIDVESWAAYITAQNSVDGLIDNWNSLDV